MPTSVVYAATDPCEYGAVIRGADVNVLINGRGNFQAKVTRIDLHNMWLQRGEENLPRIFRSTPPDNRVGSQTRLGDCTPRGPSRCTSPASSGLPGQVSIACLDPIADPKAA